MQYIVDSKLASKNNIFARYLLMFISLLMSALLYNFLLSKTHIVTGGVPGIAIINNYVNQVRPSVTILILSLIMIILSYIFLGKERTKGTIVASITYPFLVELTHSLTHYYVFDISDLLVISLFIGVVSGIANGLLYSTGFSNGGLPVISQILQKYYGIPMGKSSLVINGLVILLGSFYFGSTMIMYAIIIIYINSIVVDRVLLKSSRNKALYIMTKKKQDVKKFLIDEMNHTATVFETKGALFKKKHELILTVIPTREYFQITESIKLIDPEVFYVVNNAYEVKGVR